jgi:DNA polymerase-1|tara:strand:+ start:28 stop:978 length:951 start_codon:yes stop_codon:yes gene_type:complete
MHDRPILIVDGLNCFFRHFVANPSLSENGDPIGGIVGFLKGMQLLLERYNPDRIIVVWEGGGSPRRRAIDSSYKAGRRPERLNRFYSGDIPDTVSNRNEQLSKLVKILRHTPALQFYVSDCEADDIIARLVNVNFKNEKCVIVSTDKDLYQLVSDRVKQWSPGQKAELDQSVILAKFGIHPENFCVARCFIGDGSDGLKGIRGAGFKAMSKRFPELKSSSFVSVEVILNLCRERREQKRLKLYDNIMSDQEIVKKNWKLMYLGSGNLSGTQIKKIDDVISMHAVKSDKLGFMRCLIQLSIKNFDTDRLFMTFKALN